MKWGELRNLDVGRKEQTSLSNPDMTWRNVPKAPAKFPRVAEAELIVRKYSLNDGGRCMYDDEGCMNDEVTKNDMKMA